MRAITTAFDIVMISLVNLVNIFAIAYILTVVVHCTDDIPNYISNNNIINGLVFPNEINAVVGEEIYLKIVQPVANQNECHYRKSGGKDVNVRSPHKQTIEPWSIETCGLRIRNITIADQGIWRLTSTNQKNDVARGVTIITVRDDIKNGKTLDFKMPHPIDVHEKPAYCYVLRPKQTKTIFPQHEKCDFPKFHTDLESIGKWQVMYGAQGKTRETSFDVNIEGNVEEVQTFTEHDTKTSTLNMKCKLVNSKRMMKFCRFLRLNDDMGFHLQEGHGNAQYQYFGRGLEHHECGISIRNPNENDKSMWKCFMGVEKDKIATTVGAIVSGVEAHGSEPKDDIESDDVYGLQYTPVNLLCKRKSPTDYCWFRDPSGNKISLSDRTKPKPNDTYRYYGTGVKLGECGLTIMNASRNDSGTWSCHLGVADVSNVDQMKEISLRITATSLASTALFQDAQIGTSLSVECRSIPEHVPLDYCRFVLPDGTGFSLNEKSTIDNPHMKNFYYNPNREMKSGYCSLIIKSVDRSHFGQWMCAARLKTSESESFDEFRVTVYENEISAAGISGMAVSLACVIGLGIVLSYMVYRKIYAPVNQRRETTVTYVPSTDHVSIASVDSNDSQAEIHIPN